MGNYFKPLRRKIGLATLVVACVFVGAWVRSSTTQDTFTIGLGASLQVKLVSVSQQLIVVRLTIEGEPALSTRFWMSQQPTDASWALSFQFLDSTQMTMLNAVTSDVYSVGNCGMSDDKSACAVTWCQFPYWTIVMPLTLVSAWLLLRNPRKWKSKSTRLDGSAQY